MTIFAVDIGGAIRGTVACFTGIPEADKVAILTNPLDLPDPQYTRQMGTNMVISAQYENACWKYRGRSANP